MIDYTGKLNEHTHYLQILNKLKKKTSYIEIVLIDGKKTNNLVEKFKNQIISIESVSEWWGTKTFGRNRLVRINSSDELFSYLESFETFCKYYTSKNRGDYSLLTDFGIDDIAFYDSLNDILLCTTTHEGYIIVNEKLI